MVNYIKIFLVFFILSLTFSNDSKLHLIKLPTYDYESEDQFFLQQNITPPYTVLFKKKLKQIIYLAAKHETGLNSHTFQLINKTINTFNPDLIIIEGYETKMGFSDLKLIKTTKSCSPNWLCGEPLYASYLAHLKSIPFLGGEPSDQNIFNILQTKGYSKEDIIFFYFTRQIPQYYREKRILTLKDISILYKIFLKKLLQNPKNHNVPSFDKYMAWLNDIHPDLTYKNLMLLINPNFTAPLKNGNFIQQISNEINNIRDKHIVTILLKLSNYYNKILIIYGHSHYFTQKSILEKYFGKPVYFNFI